MITMPHTIKILRASLFLLFLASTSIAFSQKNSPWKKLSNQTVNGAYLGLGRHQYSLDGGQGFSVYIKNYNAYPVVVSGKVIAKTLCGTEIVSNFSTTLAPDQESSGGNYADSSNSQTGVVKKEDCAGKKIFTSPKHAVTNRIQDVYVKDVTVESVGSSQVKSNAVQTEVSQAASVRKSITSTVVQNSSDAPNYKQKYDSLSGIVGFLKDRNITLQDSLINLKSRLSKMVDANKDSLIQAVPYTKKKSKPKKIINTTPYFGIGWEHLPLILNQDSVKALSIADASAHPILLAGATFSFFDSLPVSFQLNPFASYGVNLGSGTCGNHFTGGGVIRLLAGLKYNAPVKLFVEGGIIYREGSWSKNVTVLNRKTQQVANYEYNLTRIGGGIQYQWNGGNSFLRPAIFLETPSKGTSTSVLTLEFQFNKKWKATINYADNYFVAGIIKHPTTYTDNTQNYFKVGINYNIGTY